MLYLMKIAARNVFRNMRRSVLSGLSIMFAVAAVIFLWSFIDGEGNAMFDVMIKVESGNVRVLNAEFAKRERMMPLKDSIKDYEKARDVIASEKGVKVATGRIKFGVLIEHEGNNKQMIGIGIDPSREEGILELSKKLVSGRMIQNGKDETVIGAMMANELGLRPGKTLMVVTQTAFGSLSAKDYKIVGVVGFGAGMVDRKMFFVPLSSAQDLLDMGNGVSEIIVMLKDPGRSMAAAKQISARLGKDYTIKPWQESMVYYFMLVFSYLMMIIYAIVLVLSAFTILNTMFMAVLERTKEIGMMKALGMKNDQLTYVILFEALLLGLLSSIIGSFIGGLLIYYFSINGMDYTQMVSKMDFPMANIIYTVFSFKYIIVGGVTGVVLSVLAAVLPALRATKLEPTEALHEI